MRLFSGIKFEFKEQRQYKSQAQQVAKDLREKGYLVRVVPMPKMMGGGWAIWVTMEKVDRYGRKYPR